MRIKSASNVEPYGYVYRGDDALDPGEDREEFIKIHDEAMEDCDLSKLPVRAGQNPVVWKLQHLRGAVKWAIKDMIRDDYREKGFWRFSTLYAACRFSLVGVSGLRNDNNQPINTVPRFTESDRWGGAPAVTEGFMEDLGNIQCGDSRTDDSLIEELGAIAIDRMLIRGKS